MLHESERLMKTCRIISHLKRSSLPNFWLLTGQPSDLLYPFAVYPLTMHRLTPSLAQVLFWGICGAEAMSRDFPLIIDFLENKQFLSRLGSLLSSICRRRACRSRACKGPVGICRDYLLDRKLDAKGEV